MTSFFPRNIWGWNSLPPQLIEPNNLDSFRSNCTVPVVYVTVCAQLALLSALSPNNNNNNNNNSAACPSYTNNHLKMMYPLHIFDSYAQPATQQYELRTVHPKSTSVITIAIINILMLSCTPNNGSVPINYCLKSELSITFHHPLHSTCHTQQYKSRTIQKAPLLSKKNLSD